MVICLEQGADCLHYGPADATTVPKLPSVASYKSRLVLPFWYQVSPLVLEKRPLSGHSSSSFHILTSQNSIFIWLWGCFKVLYIVGKPVSYMQILLMQIDYGVVMSEIYLLTQPETAFENVENAGGYTQSAVDF